MKTIAHYISFSYLPITENWIYEQIKNLKIYHYIVYAHKTENLDIYGDENIKIRSLQFKNLIDPWTFFNKGWNKIFGFYIPQVFYLMKDRPDLIHAHFGTSGYDCLIVKKILKVPLITTFYGFDLSLLPQQKPQWKKKYKKLFAEGELFLVEGNYMKKSLIGLGCPDKKIKVQHLGIDLEKIKFVPRKLGLDGKVKILLSASFREKKGIPYAIEAFAKVRNKYKNLFLTIIGGAGRQNTESREKKQILTVINKYDLQGCINMMGYQPHSVFLEELYRHHIFIHPSIHAADGDNEGGAPVSLIEASASGMPVISTMHCDIPEVIINGKSGFLVPERDINALAEKLEYIMQNSDLWFRFGLAGRKHIENNYDIRDVMDKLTNIYESISVV